MSLVCTVLILFTQWPLIRSQGSHISLIMTSTVSFPTFKFPMPFECSSPSLSSARSASKYPCGPRNCRGRPRSSALRYRRRLSCTFSSRKFPWKVDAPRGGIAGSMSTPTTRPPGWVHATAIYVHKPCDRIWQRGSSFYVPPSKNPVQNPRRCQLKKQWLHQSKERNYQINDGHSWLEKLTRMIQLHDSSPVNTSGTMYVVKPNLLSLKSVSHLQELKPRPGFHALNLCCLCKWVSYLPCNPPLWGGLTTRVFSFIAWEECRYTRWMDRPPRSKQGANASCGRWQLNELSWGWGYRYSWPDQVGYVGVWVHLTMNVGWTLSLRGKKKGLFRVSSWQSVPRLGTIQNRRHPKNKRECRMNPCKISGQCAHIIILWYMVKHVISTCSNKMETYRKSLLFFLWLL